MSYMLNKLRFICIGILALLVSLPIMARDKNPLGQIIHIRTRLHSFVGRPSWLLVIRDVDNGQNIPYLYDIHRGHNTWFAFTLGRNYLILASTLSFSPYSRHPYRSVKVHNFCHLESNGRIIRGQSLHIYLEGELSPYPERFTCNVVRYYDDPLTMTLI